MDTSEKLRKRRGELGLTQWEVADLANVNHVQYNGYETGRHEPSQGTMDKIARALKASAESLWGDEEVSEDSGTADGLREALRRRIAKDANWPLDRVRVVIHIE
jgi:transcriptional regulator with XRE-family HTH domain